MSKSMALCDLVGSSEQQAPAYLISILSALRLSFGVGSSQKSSCLDLMLGFKVLLALAADHIRQMDVRLHGTLECIGWWPFRTAQSLLVDLQCFGFSSVQHACFRGVL